MPSEEGELLLASRNSHAGDAQRGHVGACAGSRRAPYLIVAAILAAGAIDGVVRVHMGYASWDVGDEMMSRQVTFLQERLQPDATKRLRMDDRSRGTRQKLAQLSPAGAGEGSEGDGVIANLVSDETRLTPEEIDFVNGHATDGHATAVLRKIGNFGDECLKMNDCNREYVCSDGVCAACQSNEQCWGRSDGASLKCFMNVDGEAGHNLCKHKPLLDPLSWNDIALGIITFCTTALAAPTGAGGGGILVPMFMLIGQFAAHSAVPLSKASILGGAIANNFINVQRKHPFANRPVVDYEVLQLLVPTLLSGCLVGVFLNAVSPDWLICIFLIGTLGWSGYSAGKKAWKLYQEEKEESQMLLGKKEDAETDKGGQHEIERLQSAVKPKHWSFGSKDDMSPELFEIVKEESKASFKTFGILSITWILIISCAFGKSYATCGSVQFWLIALLPIPFTLAMAWSVGNDVYERHERKRAMGYKFSYGDVVWTQHNVRFLVYFSAFVAGVGAGALGLAAGALLAPPLLATGQNPLVTVATTGYMVLYTSSSTVVQYCLLGSLQLDYAAFYVLVSMVAAVVGNTFLQFLVRKYRKTWIVVGLLAFLLFISLVLLGCLGIYRTYIAWIEDDDMDFRDLCVDSGTAFLKRATTASAAAAAADDSDKSSMSLSDLRGFDSAMMMVGR